MLAVEIVRAWVGDRGSVADTSDGAGPDFAIAYNDGTTALGEVGWHEDRVIQEMWANTIARERHQVVELAPHSGHWSISLTRSARIKALHRELPNLIEALSRAGLTSMAVSRCWPRSEVADKARALGIERVQRVSDESPGMAIYFLPGVSGGFVPGDANVIVSWIDEVLDDPDCLDTCAKLIDRDADERHVFLMTGSRTPFGVDERLRRIADLLPSVPPTPRQGITHYWAVSRFNRDDARALVWSPESGWDSVLLPEIVPGH